MSFCPSDSVPPSEPYFEMDTLQHWVAGRKYSVICVAPDAKPEAEITLYKGESWFQLSTQLIVIQAFIRTVTGELYKIYVFRYFQ